MDKHVSRQAMSKASPESKTARREPAAHSQALRFASTIGNSAMGDIFLGGKSADSGERNSRGIPDWLREKFEPAAGVPLDDVEVHYNSEKPAELDALAYAQGNQVYIGPGQEKHLEHELGHVVQQKQGRVRPERSIGGVAVNDSQELEREAERFEMADAPGQGGYDTLVAQRQPGRKKRKGKGDSRELADSLAGGGQEEQHAGAAAGSASQAQREELKTAAVLFDKVYTCKRLRELPVRVKEQIEALHPCEHDFIAEQSEVDIYGWRDKLSRALDSLGLIVGDEEKEITIDSLNNRELAEAFKEVGETYKNLMNALNAALEYRKSLKPEDNGYLPPQDSPESVAGEANLLLEKGYDGGPVTSQRVRGQDGSFVGSKALHLHINIGKGDHLKIYDSFRYNLCENSGYDDKCLKEALKELVTKERYKGLEGYDDCVKWLCKELDVKCMSFLKQEVSDPVVASKGKKK